MHVSPLLGRAVCAGLILAGVAASQIAITPADVSLSAPANTTDVVRATVTVASRSLQALPFSASVRHLGNVGGWLSVSPVSGTTPQTLTLTANPSGLPTGTHLAQVTVNAGGIGAVANVVFSVGSGTTGDLSVDPSGITFIGQSNQAILPGQTLNIISATNRQAAVRFRATAGSVGNWLSVTPLPGTTPGQVRVEASQAGLAPGLHTGSVTITPLDGGAPTVVPVVLLAVGTGVVQQSLVLSQTALSFNHQFGAATPPLQSLDVQPTASPVSYTAATVAPWLELLNNTTLTPSSSVAGTAPDVLSVQVNPTGLAPGTYAGSIVVTATGLPPQELPVSLRVTTSPALNADPSSILFNTASVLAMPVVVTSSGATSINFSATVSPAASWLTVTPVTGSTASGYELLSVVVDASTLLPGTYTSSIVLAGTNATGITIPVTLRVPQQAAAASDILSFSRQSVALSAVSGTGDVAQVIDVISRSAGHEFTASASSTGGWLKVDPFRGVTQSRITVRADPNAVPSAGTHTGNVTVTSLVSGAAYNIPVTFTVDAETLSVEPRSLTFTQQQRGVTPPRQNIRITSNTPVPVVAVATVDWIKIDPPEGNTPTTLSIWVDVSMVPPGSNTGTIVIAGPNSQATVSVTASVLPPSAPVASPESLNLTYSLGGTPPGPQTIQVGSTLERITFTATARTSSGVPWLAVAPSSGTTPTSITATVSPNLLVPGRHTGTITITSADGQVRNVGVNVTVNASTVVPAVVLHGASFEPTAVSPGQIITLTGTGIGPATGVAARATAAGAIETQLGGVRVLFDSVPAPLLYVRSDQINAIVPYALAGRLSTRMQIENGTNLSIPLEIKVVDAAPGLFTANGSGRGQAAALNVDYTANSMANPAARGSVLSLYGTGEGQTDPQGQDGRIISTDLRTPRLQVAATIGGVPARVLYIGSAPGLVSGAFQANIEIPAEVPAGAQPVVLTVGGVPTQNGVTVVVR